MFFSKNKPVVAQNFDRNTLCVVLTMSKNEQYSLHSSLKLGELTHLGPSKRNLKFNLGVVVSFPNTSVTCSIEFKTILPN